MRAAPHVSAPLASAGYRRGLESVATREELAAAIMRRTLLPGRRFRVEGANVGNNSALVFEHEGKNLISRFGGVLYEVVTAWQFHGAHEACEVDCPRCKAPRTFCCVIRRGSVNIPCRVHLARLEALPRRTACPRCLASPMAPCVSTRGKSPGTPMKKQHRERVAADEANHAA